MTERISQIRIAKRINNIAYLKSSMEYGNLLHTEVSTSLGTRGISVAKTDVFKALVDHSVGFGNLSNRHDPFEIHGIRHSENKYVM